MSTTREFARVSKASGTRKGFAIHLAVYVLVNALLVGINLATTPDRLWFAWPLLGWGIGLLAHAFAAFALAGRRPRS